MKRVAAVLVSGRFWALALKELRQIRRDRRLMISLVVPPTLQILLFGIALDPEVQNLRLGVVDDSRTPQSRQVVSAFTENRTFRLGGYYTSPELLGAALGRGALDVGLVIPRDFARRRLRGDAATVQILLNAVNANTAQIAQGYAEGAIAWLNQRGSGPGGGDVGPVPPRAPGGVTARIALLYNPGLVTSWFIVTGVLGTLIVLNGSLVASATMIREKESGTVEQLLMTPTTAIEIVAAKMTPLFLLLMGMVALALVLARAVFRVPFRGDLWLILAGSALCVLTGIGIGTLIATLARSATQAQLMSFFVNPPIAALSGGFTPIEAMPPWIQPLTLLNPVRHFATIARGVLIKGVGLGEVYAPMLALLAFTAVLVGLSVWRFRRQLA